MIYKKLNGVVVQDANISNEKDKKEFIRDVRKFMGEYTDPVPETEEAVDSSAKKGFAIEAKNGKDRLGLAVVTRAPFDRFQPKYHLAYIATSPKARGKGVGRLLLETVTELTDGSIALHVGINNKDALSFYKKMGWESVYLRMMPS